MLTIIGPTASGKTTFATALAASMGAEIISADSRQVYRRMDIGHGERPCRLQGGRYRNTLSFD